MKTVRDIIQQSARLCGLIDTFDDLESDEATLMLSHLNLLLNTYDLMDYFPYKLLTNDVEVANGKITIGKNKLFDSGEQELPDYITFKVILPTGYNGTQPSGDIYTFSNLQNTYTIPNNYTLALAKGTHVSGGEVVFENGQIKLWNGTDIPVGAEITISKHTVSDIAVAGGAIGFYVDTIDGIYTLTDLLIETPTSIVSVLNTSVQHYYALQDVSPVDMVNYGYAQATQLPTKYTWFNGYPLGEIQFYPQTTATKFRVTSRYVNEEFDYNDYINLPKGYDSLIVYGLAHKLAIIYGYFDKVSYLEKMETQALSLIKAKNSKGRMLNSNPIGRNRFFNLGYGYDINSDTNY
jgi:hypothetical protein